MKFSKLEISGLLESDGNSYKILRTIENVEVRTEQGAFGPSGFTATKEGQGVATLSVCDDRLEFTQEGIEIEGLLLPPDDQDPELTKGRSGTWKLSNAPIK